MVGTFFRLCTVEFAVLLCCTHLQNGAFLMILGHLFVLDKLQKDGQFFIWEDDLLYELYLFQDAQNRVAAFALYRLFPDLPIHLTLTEPYASLVVQWKEGNSVCISSQVSRISLIHRKL